MRRGPVCSGHIGRVANSGERSAGSVTSMASARPRLVGNALGSLAFLALIVLVAFGLPALDNSLPAARPLPDRVPFAVGAGITVVPPPAASRDVSQTRPEASRGTALFTLGSI